MNKVYFNRRLLNYHVVFSGVPGLQKGARQKIQIPEKWESSTHPNPIRYKSNPFFAGIVQLRPEGEMRITSQHFYARNTFRRILSSNKV